MSARIISFILASVVSCLSLMVPLRAHAELSGSLIATTNYISSGYSKSDGNPAIQANVDYEHNSGLYVGAWASSIDFSDDDHDDRSNIEVAPYLGFWFRASPDWSIDTTLTRYLYDDKIFGRNSDYNEVNLQVDFREIVSARFAWSDSLYNRGHSAWDYELLGRYPLTDVLEVSAGLGVNKANEVFEYNYRYGNAGITWFYHSLAIDIRYAMAREFDAIHVEEDSLISPQNVRNELVLSISVGF